jgi:integrase
MRLGEIRAFAWRHIDRERRSSALKGRGASKSYAGRRPMPAFVPSRCFLPLMRRFRRSQHGLSSGAVKPRTSFVFQTNWGQPLDPQNLNHRIWTKALKHAGLGEWLEPETTPRGSSAKREWVNAYRFHDCRHTCVSRLVAAGADVKLVQGVAGHTNPLITLQRDSHLTDARVTEAAERFDSAIVRAPSGHHGGRSLSVESRPSRRYAGLS